MAEAIDGEKLRKVLKGLRADWNSEESDPTRSQRQRDMAFAGVVAIDLVVQALDDPRTDLDLATAPCAHETEEKS